MHRFLLLASIVALTACVVSIPRRPAIVKTDLDPKALYTAAFQVLVASGAAVSTKDEASCLVATDWVEGMWWHTGGPMGISIHVQDRVRLVVSCSGGTLSVVQQRQRRSSADPGWTTIKTATERDTTAWEKIAKAIVEHAAHGKPASSPSPTRDGPSSAG